MRARMQVCHGVCVCVCDIVCVWCRWCVCAQGDELAATLPVGNEAGWHPLYAAWFGEVGAHGGHTGTQAQVAHTGGTQGHTGTKVRPTD